MVFKLVKRTPTIYFITFTEMLKKDLMLGYFFSALLRQTEHFFKTLWIYLIYPSGKEPFERVWNVEAKFRK